MKAFCPDEFGAVETRKRGDRFYVYRVTSKWSKEKGKPKKVTGECVEKIVPGDGFVVNKNGTAYREKHREPLLGARPHVRGYGAYETIRQLSLGLDERLKEYFPDLFREVRTVALLRLMDGVSSAKAVRPAFLSPVSFQPVPRHRDERDEREEPRGHGGAQTGPCRGVHEEHDPARDPSSSSTGRPYSRTRRTRWRPRDTTRTTAPKPRQGTLRIGRDTAKPVFYRVPRGSVVDKTALIDTVRDSGCKDCIITADKGFCSLKTLAALMGAGERIILPLQDVAAMVDSGLYEDPDDRKFDGIFHYNGRPIRCKKTKSGNRGVFYYTFRDDARGSGKRVRFVAKAGETCDEGEKVPMDVVDEKRPGYFSFCSNLDVTSRELYMALQRRVDTRTVLRLPQDQRVP